MHICEKNKKYKKKQKYSSSIDHINNNQLKTQKFLCNKISKAYYRSCFFLCSLFLEPWQALPRPVETNSVLP